MDTYFIEIQDTLLDNTGLLCFGIDNDIKVGDIYVLEAVRVEDDPRTVKFRLKRIQQIKRERYTEELMDDHGDINT